MKLMNRSVLSLLVALGFALSACGGGEEAPTPAATPEPTPEATPEPTPEPTPEATPQASISEGLAKLLAELSDEEKAAVNPLKGKEDAVAKGKAEFMSVCFSCHGREGKGDGPAAKALNPPPADLTTPELAAVLTDGVEFQVMKRGIEGTAMQAFGAALSDEQIWSILAYLDTLQPPKSE